ncbi:MAG TPA: NnrS family protein, partial [Steroidobacteraceae bacterium]
NAARQRGDAATVRSWPAVEWGVLTTMIAVAIVDLWLPDTVLSGWIAAVAAVAQAARMTGWRTLSTRRQPILWVLHLGYGWLPVGLALKALWLVANAPWAAYWLHALTMGVFGTMIPAVMTRVALGHTGRPLIVRGSIAVSYGLLALGTLVRIAAPVLWPTAYVPALAVSSALWSGAFVLFVWVYTPILITARADGKPG